MPDEEKGFGWGKKARPGGFLDDFDGVIVGAMFQDGEWGVQLTLSLKNLDPEYTGENQPAWYSMGKGEYVVIDGGERVSGEMYRENSKLDLLVNATLRLGAKLPIGDTASIWEGLAFHWNRVTMSSVATQIIKIEGKEPEILIPTKYLGTHEVLTAEGTVSEVASAISEAFVEALQIAEDANRTPLKWNVLLLRTVNKHPELKAATIKGGREILAGLVKDEIVAEEDGGYKLVMEF